MLAALTLLAVAAVAYVLAHLVVDRLQERFFFHSGALYLLAGVALGPTGAGVVETHTLSGLAPLLSLAIGWLGLSYGARLDLRGAPVQGRLSPGRTATIETTTTALVAGLLAFVAMRRLPLTGAEVKPGETWLVVGALAVAAAVAAPEGFEALLRRHHPSGALSELLQRESLASELITIVAFGALFCMFHAEPAGATALPRSPTAAEWFLISVGLGAVLGLLARGLLGSAHDEDRQFLVLTGIIVFASGLAHYLDLSPLLVNMVLGGVLINVAGRRTAGELAGVLQRTEGPMAIVLLFFAGAMWRPAGWAGAVFALFYLASRALARLAAGTLAALDAGEGMPRDLGRGLMGHGIVAVAMALNLQVALDDAVSNLAATAILASVLASELWAPRLLRGLLIDAGEIPQDQAAEAGSEAR